MGVSENVVYPEKPNGFADHYPVSKWLAIIGAIPHFQTYPCQARSRTGPFSIRWTEWTGGTASVVRRTQGRP